MISKKHTQVACLLLSAAYLIDSAESLSLKSLQKDSWQDFFGEDTHIQKASLPKPKVPAKDVVHVQIKVETEFQKTMKKAKQGRSLLEFLIGICMITAAFPVVWMNERVQLRMWKLVSKADNESIDLTETIDDQSTIKDENDTKLVRLHGKVQSLDGVQDEHIKSVKLVNGLVIERMVEKYEEITVNQEAGSPQQAVSKQYRWSRMRDQTQPSHDIDQIFYAANARLGPYLIGKDSLQKLTNFDTYILPDGEKSSILEDVKKTYVNCQKVVIDGGHITVRMTGASDLDIPGDYRISWRTISANKEYTVMGQQMKIDDKGTTSFRQWNPEKVNVAWGEDNSIQIEVEQKDNMNWSQYFRYLISGCVEKALKSGFHDVVNVMSPGIIFKKQIIQDLNQSSVITSGLFRLAAWTLFCLGVFLLFSPIIALFKFIPLMGWAFANLVGYEAVVFAVVIGSITHLITLTVAWILHRPLFGVGLLVGVCLLVSLLFQGVHKIA